MQTFFFQKVIKPAATKAPVLGGAKRDRTADPLLAKQVLSQLSYSPDFFCPHAAAACAASLRTGRRTIADGRLA